MVCSREIKDESETRPRKGGNKKEGVDRQRYTGNTNTPYGRGSIPQFHSHPPGPRLVATLPALRPFPPGGSPPRCTALFVMMDV